MYTPFTKGLGNGFATERNFVVFSKGIDDADEVVSDVRSTDTLHIEIIMPLKAFFTKY
jgi:hypothetical protein